MKNKVVTFLLVFTLILPFLANPSLAAKNQNNGDNGNNGKVKVEKIKEEKIKEEKVEREKVKKEKNNLSEKVKPEKKEKIKEKIQIKVEKDTFKDSQKHWANDSIEKAKALGWINGYPDGTFKPEETISNLELITIAMNVVDNLAKDENEDIEEDEIDEEDLDEVPGWAKDKVKKAADKNIINLNRFNSHVQVTRAQAAISLAKALELEPVVSTEDSFTDSDLISEEDLGYILALLNEGIITGTPEGKFNPNDSITRGEIATILANIAEKIVEETEESEEVGDDTSDTSDNESE
ncbi:S-layer homology domain-containing protein [Tissierella sp. Yu-01]|uniref:S-layer homology domain-containing protein n=1 Tax=Tissierella sp. Yu-01 TaxID=3035694 RepID=UPI00240E4B28|nr:S-layer homology domain-containing protein [Tissierella sp. Yu-01]WFA08605.1 S-layer homology domain-containing protein [Tissierella sp. Yu-01]